MSLLCHECGFDVQPSEVLPGREGTFIHPNVLSIVWTTGELIKDKLALAYIEAPQNLCLCFQCIANHLPPYQHALLDSIYEAYKAEIDFRQIDISQKGKWISGDESGVWMKSFDFFKEKLKAIPASICLFCNATLPADNKPYFTVKTIDKVYSQQNLSVFSSYSWSNCQTGTTGFKICFDCCKDNFPRILEQLSYDLRGIKESNLGDVAKSEFYITPAFIEKLKEEVGDEEARKYPQELQDMINN